MDTGLIVSSNILLYWGRYIEYWNHLSQDMLKHAEEKITDTTVVLVYSSFPIPTCSLEGTCTEPNIFGKILYYKCGGFYLVVDWEHRPRNVFLVSWYLYISEVWHTMEAIGCICPVHVWSEASDPCIGQFYCPIPGFILLVCRYETQLHLGWGTFLKGILLIL